MEIDDNKDEDGTKSSRLMFSLLQDKPLPFASTSEPLLFASCCPTMDLLALATRNKLTVQRSIKWEKLFTIQTNVTSLAWRPDGKALCAGHEDGTLSMFDIESGEELPLPYSTYPHSTYITCMYWTCVTAKKYGADACPNGESKVMQELFDEMELQATVYTDRGKDPIYSALYMMNTALRCIVPPSSKRTSSTNLSNTNSVLENSHLYRGAQSVAANLLGINSSTDGTNQNRDLHILASGDKAGVVTLSAYGFFPIGCIDLSDAFKEEKTGNGDTLPVTDICLSSDLNCLVAVLKHICRANDGSIVTNYRVATVKTKLLNEKSREIQHLAETYGHIGEHISDANDTVQTLAKQWDDTLAPLHKQIEPLVHQLKCFDRPSTAEEELFMMLTCGVTSNALQQYFASMTEQSFQKLGRQLDSACENMENTINTRLIRQAEALVFRIADLMGLAKYEEKFEDIGLETKSVENLLRASELILLKVQEIQIKIQDARANFAAFTTWLRGVIRKQNIEEEMSRGCTTERFHSLRQRQNMIPVADTDRLLRLLGPPEEFASLPSLETTCGQLFHKHITEEFENKPPSTSFRNKYLAINEENPESWYNITEDLPSFAYLSLKQITELLMNRWKLAFHKPSECISRSFKPVDNIPLFSFRNPGESKSENFAIVSPGEMSMHFRSNLKTNDIPSQLYLAFVLNLQQQKSLGIPGSASTVWIMQRSTSEAPSEWSVGCFTLDLGTEVVDLAFYGESAGNPDLCRNSHGEYLLISTASKEKEMKRMLVAIDYTNMSFKEIKQIPALQFNEQLARHQFVWDPSLISNGQVIKYDQIQRKIRKLTPSNWTMSKLCVSGSRGVACVFSNNSRLQLFDIEEDEEDEEDFDD